MFGSRGKEVERRVWKVEVARGREPLEGREERERRAELIRDQERWIAR